MDDRYTPLDLSAGQALLGYLNFSDGRADPRWQKQLDDAFAIQARAGVARPWDALLAAMGEALSRLQAGGGAAFRDAGQACAVLSLAAETLPAYRRHHADLLAHLDDAELFGPLFLARVFEACLQLLRHPDGPTAELVVARLNDFVGHRPIALLETRPQGEPYEHERHRPVPLFLRGAGAASGRYQAVVDYSPRSAGAKAYAQLTEEIIANGQRTKARPRKPAPRVAPIDDAA